MAKPSKKQKPEIETVPNAWERFERAVDVVIKAKPKHRAPKGKTRKRVAKGQT